EVDERRPGNLAGSAQDTLCDLEAPEENDLGWVERGAARPVGGGGLPKNRTFYPFVQQLVSNAVDGERRVRDFGREAHASRREGHVELRLDDLEAEYRRQVQADIGLAVVGRLIRRGGLDKQHGLWNIFWRRRRLDIGVPS